MQRHAAGSSRGTQHDRWYCLRRWVHLPHTSLWLEHTMRLLQKVLMRLKPLRSARPASAAGRSLTLTVLQMALSM